MAAAQELRNPPNDPEIRDILKKYEQKLFQPTIQKGEYVYLKVTTQIQKLIGKLWIRTKVIGYDLPHDLYLLEHATDKDGFHMENIATQLKKGMAWEGSLPIMTRKKEYTVQERSIDPNHHHNNEDEYPILILQQNTDLRADLSDLPSDSRNRAHRQDYPMLADEPNIIITCTELPLNEAIGDQKSTTEKKWPPVNKNKK